MYNWINCKIGDLGQVVGGATPPTTDDGNYNGSVPWITPKDLSGLSERYISKGARNITEKGFNSCSAKSLPANSVLFSSRAPIGYVAIARNKVCTNQGFKSIIPNKNVDSVFLYYLLCYNKEKIESMASGTTFKEVSGSVMKQVPVFVPSNIKNQKAIAAALSCLDDKIELNNRMNRTLEEMAQAIFKSWFVDFEPFQDGEFVESELGLIPQDWKVMKLGEVCIKVTDGSHYSPKNDMRGIHPMLSVKDMASYGFTYAHCKMIDDEEYCQMQASDCVPQIDDILIAKDGSYLKEIFITNENKEEAILSSIAIFRPNRDILYPELLLYLLKQPNIKREVMDNFVSGSALPRIVLKDFKRLKIIVPSKEAQEQVIKIYRAIRRQITANCKENRFIKEMRDQLLPKLMSGKIIVPVEK